MGDSEEECDTWRNRDKYPKEREEAKPAKSASPAQLAEPRIEKRSFNNSGNSYHQSPNKSVEPPFKRQRREPMDDYSNSNHSNNMSNNREPRREPSYNNSSVPTKAPLDDTPNYPTQPPMLLFKHFLQQQDDDIEMDQAMRKYNDYRQSFVTKQLRAFFDSHHTQEWFREKYLPPSVTRKRNDTEINIQLRKSIFMYLYERNWMDNIKIHVDETDNIVRVMDAVVILLEGGNARDLTILFSKRYRSESPNDSHDLEEKSIKTDEKLISGDKSIKIDEKSILDDTPIEIIEEKETEEEINEESAAAVVEGGELKETKSDTAADGAIDIPFEGRHIDESVEPRALHKTFSIFLRNLHPNVLRSEIEALVKPYSGFLRLALQDPTPDRKFFRRGWVTYDRSVNIKEICWNLNNIRLHDCDIGAIVNRELTQRIRPVMVLANHRPVMRHDVKMASRLVAKFDKRHNLWGSSDGSGSGNPLSSNNPLLANITEYLVDEGSYEEEALLGGNLNCSLELLAAGGGGDPTNIKIEADSALAAVLDRLILYLRFVHSFDYYSTTEYQIEDEMPHRCGILHARGAHIHLDKPLSQREVEDYIRCFEARAELILNSVDQLPMDEARRLGFRTLDEAVDAFITDNTQEIAKDKWLCPLSGKKFKGPDFVQKHILNKHLDKVEIVRQQTEFFNNYLIDPRRPQLPEHPSNRPGAKNTESGEINQSDNNNNNNANNNNNNTNHNRYNNNNNNNNNRNIDNGNNNNGRNNGGGRRNDDFDNRRNNNSNNNNYRGSSPGPYRDFGGRNGSGGGNNNNNNNNNSSSSFGDNRGGGNNNGNYYRKNSYPARGNQTRQRNGGGSYYNRKMLSYNDLDAPNDE